MNIWSRFIVMVLGTLAACKTPVHMGTPLPEASRTDLSINGITHSQIVDILRQYPDYFKAILSNPEYKVQIIYTQVDRQKKSKAIFTDYYFNVNDSSYFYPASTVKLPVAIMALQKLNELKIKDLDKNSTMISEANSDGQTEVYNDPSTPDGRPTIAHYIKKILLVSDNDAFNRLYEFLGQEYINNTLHKMGYEEVQILHRLDISLTEDENRHTNPVRFFDRSGKLVYEKPMEESKLIYANRNTKMGQGYFRDGQLVNEPFDFSKKNRMSLTTLHNIVRSIMFPESVSRKQRFKLTKDDYEFLRKYMSMTPLESKFPSYDSANHWDTYVKFLFYGAEKNAMKNNIRIFNKPGDAYGFMIDAAYIVDYDNQVEFILSAIIHCNSDGIFNDDKYDYEEIGLPFMKHLGQVIYDHELKREKKVISDVGNFRFNYSQ